MSKSNKLSRTQEFIKYQVSITGRDQGCITGDVLDRFIESVRNGGEIDRDAAEQVVILLRAFREGAEYQENMTKELREVFGFTRKRKNKFNTASLEKKLEILNEIKAYSEGELKHVDVVKLVAELLCVEQEHSEKLVARLKPVVDQKIQSVLADIKIEEWNNTSDSHEYDLERLESEPPDL